MSVQINIDKISALLLSALMIFMSFNNNVMLKKFGLLSLLFFLIFALIVYSVFQLKINFNQKVNSTLLIFYLLFFIFLSTYIIGFLRFPDFAGFTNTVQLTLLFFLVLFISNTKWEDFYLKLFGDFVATFLVLIFIFWILKSFPKNFAAHMTNPNAFGAYTFSISFFLLVRVIIEENKIKKTIYTIIAFMALVLLLSTNSRSVLIAVFIIFLVYLSWNNIIKKKLIYYSFFSFVIFLMFCFIYYYPRLYEYPNIFNVVNQVSAYFGKTFYSGRELIWKEIIDKISEHWIIGLGAGANTLTLLGQTIGTHNLYLQLLIQVGTIGIFILILMFFSLWKIYRKLYISFRNTKESKIIRLSASFLVGIMFHQMFEVTLTQNNLSIGVIQWFSILLPLSFIKMKS